MDALHQRQLLAEELLTIHVENLNKLKELRQQYSCTIPATYHYWNKAIEVCFGCRIPWERINNPQLMSREEVFAAGSLYELQLSTLVYDYENSRDYQCHQHTSVQQYLDWIYEQREAVLRDIQILCQLD